MEGSDWGCCRCVTPPVQTSPVNFLGMIGKELGIMHVMEIAGDRSPVLWEVRASQ